MKSCLYTLLFLLSANSSFAQAPISDTTKATVQNGSLTADTSNITIRNGRGDCYYYIDGVKVLGSANLPKTAVEEVTIITGGIPVNYGDINSSIIRIGYPKIPSRKIIISDKEQNMATE